MSKQGSRISALRVALALCAVLLLLVFILETASAWTSAISVLTAPAAGVALLLAPYLGLVLAVSAALGRSMQQPNAARRNRRI